LIDPLLKPYLDLFGNQPMEVGGCRFYPKVIFLSSDGADMINGADLVVDGGYTIR
jgi:NAD(P)-dependent dehydrogenase (short-subunit alcohol dehydrogenase family)